MKRSTKIIVFLVVLALMFAAFFVITNLVKKADEKAKEANKEEKIVLFKGKNMSLAKWEYEGDTVTFTVSGTTWTPKGVYNFPLDTTYTDAMKSAVKEISSVRWIEDVEDYSMYGLEGSQVIRLHLESDTDKGDFVIGSYNAATGKCYVMKEGDDTVYLVTQELRSAFEHTLLQLATVEEITKPEGVFAFSIEVNGKSVCLESVEQFDAVSTGGSQDYKWVIRPDGVETEAEEPVDGAVVDGLMKCVEGFIDSLVWGDSADVDLRPSENETYGFDTPTCKVTMYYHETASVSTGDFNEDGSSINEDVVFTTPLTYTFGKQVDTAYYGTSSSTNRCYMVEQSIVSNLLNAEQYLDQILTTEE